MTRSKQTIKLDDPNLSAISTLRATVQGITPYLSNRFSTRIQNEILHKQEGKAKAKKKPKVPEENFLDSIHWIGPEPKNVAEFHKKKTWKYGVPATAFKGAMVRMAKLSGTPMTDARTMFFVHPTDGDLVKMKCKPPTMRQDYCRIANGGTDIRHRAEFQEWECEIEISYNARQVSAEQITSWLINAGVSNGVGDWRPAGRNSTGTYGCWKVVKAEAEIAQVDEAAYA